MATKLSFWLLCALLACAPLADAAWIIYHHTTPPAGGNVTYDTSSKNGGFTGLTGTPLQATVAITVGNNTNRLLLICATTGDETLGTRTVDSVSSSVDGAFTAVTTGVADDGNWTHTSMWYKVNPTVGAHTVTVVYVQEGGADPVATGDILALSLYNVDQATPVGAGVPVTGTSSTPTVSVTLGSDDMAVGCITTDAQGSLSFTAGTSRQLTQNIGSDIDVGMATNTGTGSIPVTASTSNDAYAIVGVPVNGG